MAELNQPRKADLLKSWAEIQEMRTLARSASAKKFNLEVFSEKGSRIILLGEKQFLQTLELMEQDLETILKADYNINLNPGEPLEEKYTPHYASRKPS